jgi:hypothetical protein
VSGGDRSSSHTAPRTNGMRTEAATAKADRVTCSSFTGNQLSCNAEQGPFCTSWAKAATWVRPDDSSSWPDMSTQPFGDRATPAAYLQTLPSVASAESVEVRVLNSFWLGETFALHDPVLSRLLLGLDSLLDVPRRHWLSLRSFAPPASMLVECIDSLRTPWRRGRCRQLAEPSGLDLVLSAAGPSLCKCPNEMPTCGPHFCP